MFPILFLHFWTAEQVPEDAMDMPQVATAVPLPADATGRISFLSHNA